MKICSFFTTLPKTIAEFTRSPPFLPFLSLLIHLSQHRGFIDHEMHPKNPNCLAGLVAPIKEPERKSPPSHLESSVREESVAYVGLKVDFFLLYFPSFFFIPHRQNLGQTCYMNSILQCLFFVEGFRNAVYSFEDCWAPLALSPLRIPLTSSLSFPRSYRSALILEVRGK